MPEILSHRHIIFRLNGKRLQGFADEDPPVEFPEIDMLDAVFGKDGALYGNDTAILGGEVVAKFQPTSQACIDILRWFAQRQRGSRLAFAGSYADLELGYSLDLRGGLFKMTKPIIVPGETFQATWVFEELIPDVDGVSFDPVPEIP